MDHVSANLTVFFYNDHFNICQILCSGVHPVHRPGQGRDQQRQDRDARGVREEEEGEGHQRLDERHGGQGGPEEAGRANMFVWGGPG